MLLFNDTLGLDNFGNGKDGSFPHTISSFWKCGRRTKEIRKCRRRYQDAQNCHGKECKFIDNREYGTRTRWTLHVVSITIVAPKYDKEQCVEQECCQDEASANPVKDEFAAFLPKEQHGKRVHNRHDRQRNQEKNGIGACQFETLAPFRMRIIPHAPEHLVIERIVVGDSEQTHLVQFSIIFGRISPSHKRAMRDGSISHGKGKPNEAEKSPLYPPLYSLISNDWFSLSKKERGVVALIRHLFQSELVVPVVFVVVKLERMRLCETTHRSFRL